MPTLYDAFISYARQDSKSFAIQLCDELTKQGFEIWLDVNDLPSAIEFQREIDERVSKSHNLIFIISPKSAKSKFCYKEIDLAVKLNKRIIPILYIVPGEYGDKMHPAIKKFDQIFFRQDKLEAGKIDLADQLTKVLSVLHRQREYVERHTRILVDARQWQRNQTQTQYLLIGEERLQAEAWLERKFDDELPPCEPTDLHCEYICASTINANNLLTQVFISYADKEFAGKLRQILMRQHITVLRSKFDYQNQVEYQAEFKEVIENADNFIYLSSSNAKQSVVCQQQLDYARELHKHVIEFDCDSEQFDLLIKDLREGAYYYEQHKILLVKALKWERWGKKATMLLRGHSLEHFVIWLQSARQDYPPLPLQIEFVEQSQAQSPSMALDIFISYSQTDSDFARQLNEELQGRGKITWFDQEDIPAGVDFKQELYQGIANADNFLFILSPKAVNSKYCEEEVKYAASLNKRILTLLYHPVDEATLPAPLINPQRIDFYNSKDFAHSCGLLLNSLEVDRDYVREHTAWLREALKWEQHAKGETYLLRGKALAEAKTWLEKSLYKLPAPHYLIEEWVVESENANLTLEWERQKEREAFEELKQARRRDWVIFGVVMVVVIGFIMLIPKSIDDSEIWHYSENGFSDAKHYEKAIANYDKTLEIKQDYHLAWNNRGILLSNLGRNEEAIASYDKALEIKQDYHEAWYNRGISFSNFGRSEEAIASYDKALEIKQDKHEAWNGRGNSLYNLGRYEEAIASYNRVLEIKPDFHYAWHNRGSSLDNLGRYEEAIASYDKALEIKPDHVAWNNRGSSLRKLGRYEEAIASFDKALEIKPDYHEAWNSRGYSLYNLGRYEEAIASFDKALEIKPDFHEAWNNRGISLRKLGRYEEAIANYDKALEIKPDKHKAWNNRGNSLSDLGRYEEAIASYDKALEIKPNERLYLRNRQLALDKLNESSD